MELEHLTTESRNSRTMNLDQMSALEIVTEMNQEDASVASAIQPFLKQIAMVARWGSQALSCGGRILYVGAGTSGRLGVLDASECPPTFGVFPGQVVGIIAGGEKALTTAVEDVEDSADQGYLDLKAHQLNAKDIVIGLAASGRTPYVLGALRYAKNLGCHTAAVACNKNSIIGKVAEIAIEPVTGPEVLTGSTRLKAGTAQKMILNMISTASMVGIGKTYENLMVDVALSNEKLKARGRRIVMEAVGVSAIEAQEAIQEADGSCKLAIVMILTGTNKQEAQALLEYGRGHIREALQGENYQIRKEKIIQHDK